MNLELDKIALLPYRTLLNRAQIKYESTLNGIARFASQNPLPSVYWRICENEVGSQNHLLSQAKFQIEFYVGELAGSSVDDRRFRSSRKAAHNFWKEHYQASDYPLDNAWQQTKEILQTTFFKKDRSVRRSELVLAHKTIVPLWRVIMNNTVLVTFQDSLDAKMPGSSALEYMSFVDRKGYILPDGAYLFMLGRLRLTQVVIDSIDLEEGAHKVCLEATCANRH